MQKTYRTAFNRGNARIWIEGDTLALNGFHHGRRFKRVMVATIGSNAPKLTLQFADVRDSDKGKGKIAGTAARPIVDLNGRYVSQFLDGATHYVATFDRSADMITIERA